PRRRGPISANLCSWAPAFAGATEERLASLSSFSRLQVVRSRPWGLAILMSSGRPYRADWRLSTEPYAASVGAHTAGILSFPSSRVGCRLFCPDAFGRAPVSAAIRRRSHGHPKEKLE